MTDYVSRSGREAFLVPALIAINVLGGKLANALSLPFFLDTIATIMAPALLSLGWGLAVAVGSSVVSSLVNFPGDIWYVGTQIVILLSSAFFMKMGFFSSLGRALLAGCVIAILATIVSAPVTAIVFQGVTIGGYAAIAGLLLASGKDLWTSTVTGTLLTSSLDKITTAGLVYFLLLRVPKRLLRQKSE